jgi:signal peptidase II
VRRVILIALAIGGADQLTKWLVLRAIDPEHPVTVIAGFFRLVNWGNTGAAWGMFRDSNLVLTVISLLTLVALYVFRNSLQLQHGGASVALGLISGGIIGNVIDRVRLRHVVDFLDFFVGTLHWPAFNVADSAICCGVALYILVSWRSEKQAQPNPAS